MDLRFVARESDFVVFEDSAGERFRVLIDDQLRDAVKHNPLPDRGGVSPREIQSRLRAGEDLEAIAADLGISANAIEPFAAPILDELNFVIQAALATKVTDGDRMLPLSEILERDNPGAKFKAQKQDEAWLITAIGTKTHVWKYDPRAKTVEPANSEASDLVKIHASRDIVTSTMPIVAEVEVEEEPASASVLDLVQELRSRRREPESSRPAPARGRASLPSWDEIVLGTNQNSESESN